MGLKTKMVYAVDQTLASLLHNSSNGDSSQELNVDAEGTEVGESSTSAGDNRTKLGQHLPKSVGLSQVDILVTD